MLSILLFIVQLEKTESTKVLKPGPEPVYNENCNVIFHILIFIFYFQVIIRRFHSESPMRQTNSTLAQSHSKAIFIYSAGRSIRDRSALCLIHPVVI